MQQKYKVSNAIAVVGKLAATFALLYLTFRLVDKPLTEWPSLIESMHISLSWLTVALLILLFTVIVNSYKWILLLKCLSPQSALRFERILYYYCAGYFFNSFITGSGDIKRAFDLGRESGQVSQALASVMLDRWSGIVGQLALTFISLQMAAHLIPALKLFNWLCALGIAFLLLAFYVTASLPSHKRPSNRFRLTCWRIQRSLARYKKFPTLLVGCLFLSLISPFLLVVAHFALAKGLNLVVTAPALFYYVPTLPTLKIKIL